LPACAALIEHVPAVSNDADVPETVQTAGVVEVKATPRPDVELAESVSLVPATSVPVIVGNVIVWASRTTKLVPTAGAAR